MNYLECLFLKDGELLPDYSEPAYQTNVPHHDTWLAEVWVAGSNNYVTLI